MMFRDAKTHCTWHDNHGSSYSKIVPYCNISLEQTILQDQTNGTETDFRHRADSITSYNINWSQAFENIDP